MFFLPADQIKTIFEMQIMFSASGSALVILLMLPATVFFLCVLVSYMIIFQITFINRILVKKVKISLKVFIKVSGLNCSA